jgi:hypothetical protein
VWRLKLRHQTKDRPIIRSETKINNSVQNYWPSKTKPIIGEIKKKKKKKKEKRKKSIPSKVCFAKFTLTKLPLCM